MGEFMKIGPSLAFGLLFAATTPSSAADSVPHGADLTPALARAHRADRPLLIYVFDRA